MFFLKTFLLSSVFSGIAATSLFCFAAETVTFTSSTIDIGMVVQDLEKSVSFYKDVIGFHEIAGFEVPSSLANDAGLTDDKSLSIRVLVLGDGPEATKLKLMRVAETSPRQGDNEFIHSHNGFRYLTIMVADTDTALARLAKNDVKPIANGPVSLPKSLAPKSIFLTCVRDPDGNIIELLGPSE